MRSLVTANATTDADSHVVNKVSAAPTIATPFTRWRSAGRTIDVASHVIAAAADVPAAAIRPSRAKYTNVATNGSANSQPQIAGRPSGAAAASARACMGPQTLAAGSDPQS